MNGLVKLLSDRKNSAAVKLYLTVMITLTNIVEDLKAEFGLLNKMLNPNGVPLEELKTIKRRIESETSLQIHKAIVGLPTGEDILTNCDVEINRRTGDGGDGVTVQASYVSLSALTPPNNETCVDKKGNVVLPDFALYKKGSKEFMGALGKVSEKSNPITRKILRG